MRGYEQWRLAIFAQLDEQVIEPEACNCEQALNAERERDVLADELERSPFWEGMADDRAAEINELKAALSNAVRAGRGDSPRRRDRARPRGLAV